MRPGLQPSRDGSQARPRTQTPRNQRTTGTGEHKQRAGARRPRRRPFQRAEAKGRVEPRPSVKPTGAACQRRRPRPRWRRPTKTVLTPKPNRR